VPFSFFLIEFLFQHGQFRLSLHVVIIITSVVPPELPMELSLAVTNSVADLMKRRIFCTEVFRIPLAGQVNVCCFDKTGTLTSDDMRLKGLRLVSECNDKRRDEGGNNYTSTDVGTVNQFIDVVEPNVTLPWSALRIMTACHSLAVIAGSLGRRTDGDQADDLIGDPLEKAVLEKTGYKMIQNNALRSVDVPAEGRPGTILVLRRFGFSSKLKRMTVLSREAGSGHTWVLTKGAPETIKQFLRSDSIPPDYDDISMHHMGLGQRVLAIAYRKLTTTEANKQIEEISREELESDLIFVGFLLLHCPIKTDSGPVVSELWNSGNRVVMITGDAMHTAAEVARQVGIIRKIKKSFPHTLQLKHFPCGRNTEINHDYRGEFQFVSLSKNDGIEKAENLTLTTTHMAKLKKLVAERKIALCVSGDALQKLVVTILERSNASNLLNGQMVDEKQFLLHPATQDVLKDVVPMCAVFARCNPRQKEAIVAAFNLGGFTTLMCGDGTNDVGALRRAHVGISIISAPEVEAKQRSATKAMSQVKAEKKKDRKKKSVKKISQTRNMSSLEKSLKELQEAQDELDQIELGDASIASPFTSRMVSIKCCKVVLQQGRCTLVTMLQIYKILGVNCLVNAMILSKLFLHGVKQGDRQLTILGIVVAGLFFLVTRGKPLPNLSATLPPTSVLCTQALVSIGLQFFIHYTLMIVATEIALSFVDPYDPSMIPDGPFNPNTLNTCTFLISVLATVNTFAVNYRGEPFVEPLRRNKVLWRSLQVCYVILFACALEIFPPLNDLFQLAEFPDVVGDGSKEWMIDYSYSNQNVIFLVSNLTRLVKTIGFRFFMLGLMFCDTILVFSVETMILRFFQK
jgi:cation-transporting ATPase 13A1